MVTDVALTSANTTTINGTQFFQQPISVARPMAREERRLRELMNTHPEYGPHKKSPRKKSNFYKWNRRRMKGEARLLKYLDTEDRLLWFEHKAICLQYSGDKRLCGHPNRILLICPKGLYEFAASGHILCRRNMWIDDDGDRIIWSYEDFCLTMIFQFQMNPQNFTDYIGCRTTVGRDDYPEFSKIYRYGLQVRKRRAAYQKMMDTNKNRATVFMLQRKRQQVTRYTPLINPYCLLG